MTQLAGQPAPAASSSAGASSAPSGAASSAPAASPLAGLGGAVRRTGAGDTPSRLRLVGAALVVLGLLVGLGAAQSFWTADGALSRADANASQLIRLQDIQTSLVRADADATNAFLVGGLEPVEQRRD